MFFNNKNKDRSGSLSRIAWRRFRKNHLAFFFFLFIILAAFIAVIGYSITPDKSPYANEQHLEIGLKKPGFSVMVLKVMKKDFLSSDGFFKTMLSGRRQDIEVIPIHTYRFSNDSIQIEEYTGDIPNEGALRSFHLAEVVYHLDSREAPERKGNTIVSKDLNGITHKNNIHDLQQIILSRQIIKKRFLLGTDRFGRDELSQLIIGSRVSLSVGFISVFISLIIGIFLGAVAGFFRGRADMVIVWFINVVWSIPTLLLVIAITFALGKGFWQIFIAVGLTMWVEVARIVRGQILSIREKEFVEAATALGYKNSRIIIRHILPNIMGPVIVISAGNFASAILIEAGLSFLGLGVQPPVPSWGSMIRENYGYLIIDYAYLAILPGIAIMLMVLAFMMVGNGLRDAFDVRDVKVSS